MLNVKCQKHYFIGREFESEAPAAEEMLDRVVCSSEQFSFQMCLENGDGSTDGGTETGCYFVGSI